MLQPKLRMMYVESPIQGEKLCRFEANVDFQKVPAGELVDVNYELYSPGLFLQRGDGSSTISFHSDADTGEVTRWFLMPQGRDYRSFRIVRYETGKSGTAEVVKGFTEYLADDSTILAYKMVSAKAGGYTYEITAVSTGSVTSRFDLWVGRRGSCRAVNNSLMVRWVCRLPAPAGASPATDSTHTMISQRLGLRWQDQLARSVSTGRASFCARVSQGQQDFQVGHRSFRAKISLINPER